MALDRKMTLNFDSHGGAIHFLTITALGADVLPWDTDLCTVKGEHKCSGLRGCVVEHLYAVVYNQTAPARMARLHEAACKAADRWLVRNGHTGPKPLRLASVRSPQARGVVHYHAALPARTPIELAWSRVYWRYVESAVQRDAERDPDERWAVLEREYLTGQAEKGWYGFGFVKRSNRHAGNTGKAARYLARNAAGYLAENASGAWHHVSLRLTRATGATMRNLRRANYLWVCLMNDLPLPNWPDSDLDFVFGLLTLDAKTTRGP